MTDTNKLTSNGAAKSNRNGFTVIEVLVTLGAAAVIFAVFLSFATGLTNTTSYSKIISSEDRILLGIRGIASSPSAIRNSMRAISWDGSGPMNPELLACAGGDQPNGCKGFQTTGLTMYSPMVSFGANGQIVGVQPVTAPGLSSNSNVDTTHARFDIYGAPCAKASAYCPFVVYTTFSAQCAPAAIASTLPIGQPNYVNSFAPQSTCMVADTITVNYSIQVDPTLIAANPILARLPTPITGSVTTAVPEISGNVPQ